VIPSLLKSLAVPILIPCSTRFQRLRSPAMSVDRGPVPEAIELDARFGLELFHQIEHELEESFSQTQPYSQEVLLHAARLNEELDVAQAMVICRRFGRACPHGVYWSRLVQRASELVGARPVNAPTAARLAAMGRLLQRIALRDLLEWSHSHGVLADIVALLESVPRDGWAYME
jgi:hypothetical protein